MLTYKLLTDFPLLCIACVDIQYFMVSPCLLQQMRGYYHCRTFGPKVHKKLWNTDTCWEFGRRSPAYKCIFKLFSICRQGRIQLWGRADTGNTVCRNLKESVSNSILMTTFLVGFAREEDRWHTCGSVCSNCHNIQSKQVRINTHQWTVMILTDTEVITGRSVFVTELTTYTTYTLWQRFL